MKSDEKMHLQRFEIGDMGLSWRAGNGQDPLGIRGFMQVCHIPTSVKYITLLACKSGYFEVWHFCAIGTRNCSLHSRKVRWVAFGKGEDARSNPYRLNSHCSSNLTSPNLGALGPDREKSPAKHITHTHCLSAYDARQANKTMKIDARWIGGLRGNRGLEPPQNKTTGPLVRWLCDGKGRAYQIHGPGAG